MTAREELYELAVCGDDRTANQKINAYRAEVLAEVLDAVADPDRRKAAADHFNMGSGLGWEAARDVVRLMLNPAASGTAPDFFQPGHTYTHRDGSTFRCDAITTHPESGWRVALGWHTDTADWTFVAVRHIDHWLYEYDRGTPTEAPTTYASTRGEPGGDA